MNLANLCLSRDHSPTGLSAHGSRKCYDYSAGLTPPSSSASMLLSPSPSPGEVKDHNSQTCKGNILTLFHRGEN